MEAVEKEIFIHSLDCIVPSRTVIVLLGFLHLQLQTIDHNVFTVESLA